MGAAPKMNRSAKGGARSSLHYGGEGNLIHPPHQGVCGRHGREEHGVTSGGLAESSGGTGVSEPISGSERVSVDLNRCYNTLSRSGTNLESIACSVCQRSTIAYASKHCSSNWSPSSSRYSMTPALDIGEGDRRRTHCARSGRRFRADRSGSSMEISEISSGPSSTKSFSRSLLNA